MFFATTVENRTIKVAYQSFGQQGETQILQSDTGYQVLSNNQRGAILSVHKPKDGFYHFDFLDNKNE